MCARMTGNPSEAEDLAQEVFLRVFLTLHSFRGESSFSTWLYRLTFNVVLMGICKKRHSEISLDAQGEEGISRPVIELSADARLSAMPDRINLNRAIDRLPHGCKEKFILHDVEGYKHKEIARMLGCSVGNSKRQLFKAHHRLRKLLAEGAPQSCPRHKFRISGDHYGRRQAS